MLVLATEDLPEQQPFTELCAVYRRGLFPRIDAAAGIMACRRRKRRAILLG